MKKYNKYLSIVNRKVFDEFEEQRGIDFMNHSSNSTNIDDFIAVAYVLCPSFIEVDGYIFIADFYNAKEEEIIEELHRLEKQFGKNKKLIEKYVNSCSFGDLFIGKDCVSMDNKYILIQFGDILIYYWTRRAKELFPDRNIIVEYGDGIMGELGLTITLYEDV